MLTENPCLRCGACCALFKVMFDQSETDEYCEGGIPVQYTVKVNETRCAMRGTETSNKRCAALEGSVARRVHCTVYDRRPSCCRDFLAAWEKDIVNPICNRARTAYGLHPFEDY